MNLNMTWSSRWMASNPVLRAGLILFAALAFVLAASGQARAADCASAQECLNSAQWVKAVADDYAKKAFFAGADAQNNFKAAADWHNKSIAAFLSGNGSAAQLYQAVANDYARKAAASQKAADNYAAQANFFRAAANTALQRGLFIAGGVKSFADYPADPGNVDGTCGSGDVCTAGTHKSCKKHPLDNYWHPRVAGADVYRAHVYTSWCFKNGVIVSRHSDTSDHQITDWGHAWSYEIDNGADQKRSYCNAAKTACFTRFQFGFRGAAVQSAGGCIETTIYGNGYHYRHAYGGTCSDTWPI